MSARHKKIELSQNLKLGVGRGNSNIIFRYGAIFCLLLAVILAANAVRLIIFSQSQTGPQSTEQVLGVSDVKQPQTTQTTNNPKIIEYKVNKGDTLFNISQKFNISWTTISALNNLKSPFTVKPGQTLNIPQ